MMIKNAIPYWKSGNSVVLVNSEGLEPKKDRTIRSYNPPVGGKKTATRFLPPKKRSYGQELLRPRSEKMKRMTLKTAAVGRFRIEQRQLAWRFVKMSDGQHPFP